MEKTEKLFDPEKNLYFYYERKGNSLMKHYIRPLETNWHIFTDGCCQKGWFADKSTGFGGWAYAITYDGNAKMINSGNSPEITTNQRMKLSAIVYALDQSTFYTSPNSKIIVYTDNEFILRCCKERWYKMWQSNGWYTTRNEPVVNQDLWKRLVEHIDSRRVTFDSITGKTNKFYTLCDKLARQAATDVRINWKGGEKHE